MSTFEISEASAIPGIYNVNYRFNDDHELVAQHNYDYHSSKEISFRGWYDPILMDSCTSVVAVWHIKPKQVA